jgi:peptidoglycan hydrolase-like protein with peptidoglycan-binding domain
MTDINGFLVSDDREKIGIRSYQVPGTKVALPVRSDVAPLLIGFARDFHAHVQPLHAGWCWGYAFRLVRGGATPSFHSAGLAIDLNAPKHPLGRRGTFDPERQRLIRHLASRYGLRWGGDYRFRADEMHFEVILNRRAALDLAATIQRRGSTGMTAHPAADHPHDHDHQSHDHPSHDRQDSTKVGNGGHPTRRIQYGGYHKHVPLGSRILSVGSAGDDVGFVQRWLGVKDDGYFGARTEKRVRDYQIKQSLGVDGKVGPDTWIRMGIRPR